LLTLLAELQRVEIRDAINTRDRRPAIDDDWIDTVVQSGFHDPWISVGPVVAVAIGNRGCDKITRRADFSFRRRANHF
jgi:hypothetical protein